MRMEMKSFGLQKRQGRRVEAALQHRLLQFKERVGGKMLVQILTFSFSVSSQHFTALDVNS